MTTSKSKRLIYGVGINDADYSVNTKSNTGKRQTCQYYLTWSGMLRRCYSEEYLKKKPTYVGCIVCEEWLTFSNFKSRMEQQDWKGKQLDKDLLGNGKLYSPATCAFVDNKTNCFFHDNFTKYGNRLLGASYEKSSGKYLAKCKNPLITNLDGKSKEKNLGRFDSAMEAHLVWCDYKQQVARQLAEHQSDQRVKNYLLSWRPYDHRDYF